MNFERFAGGAAVAVAAGGVAYSISFVLALKAGSDPALRTGFVLLLLGGILGSAVLVGLYLRVREPDPGFAILGLLLGAVGMLGSAIHGGFDLAASIDPGGSATALPNAIDPRGLLTFGLTGLGVLVLAGSIRRAGDLPTGLGWLGTALGVLLVLIYLGRLMIVDADHPLLLGLAAVTGIVVHPSWFVWLGVVLRRRPTG
ncbi:MAG TPA: hypothetical protein VE737_01315 [Actinomycetota bacterium]|jgi:hypothetical protein|nr:hypothetical protein [Actinomycetota bacterium]